MKMKHAAIGLMLGMGVAVQAAMITTGGNPSAGTGFITVEQDLNFNITESTTDFLAVIIDEAVVSDGFRNQPSLSGLEYSINGGSRVSFNTWADNALDYNSITANDSFLTFGRETVTVGDLFTIHAGTGTIGATPGFNMLSSDNYVMWVTDNTGNVISGVIPEPTTFSLLGIFGIGLWMARRKSRR